VRPVLLMIPMPRPRAFKSRTISRAPSTTHGRISTATFA